MTDPSPQRRCLRQDVRCGRYADRQRDLPAQNGTLATC